MFIGYSPFRSACAYSTEGLGFKSRYFVTEDTDVKISETEEEIYSLPHL